MRKGIDMSVLEFTMVGRAADHHMCGVYLHLPQAEGKLGAALAQNLCLLLLAPLFILLAPARRA